MDTPFSSGSSYRRIRKATTIGRWSNRIGRSGVLGSGPWRGWEQELLQKDWVNVQEGLEVKKVESPDGKEVYILCRSHPRALKEAEMHERFEKRIEEGEILCHWGKPPLNWGFSRPLLQ